MEYFYVIFLFKQIKKCRLYLYIFYVYTIRILFNRGHAIRLFCFSSAGLQGIFNENCNTNDACLLSSPVRNVITLICDSKKCFAEV